MRSAPALDEKTLESIRGEHMRLGVYCTRCQKALIDAQHLWDRGDGYRCPTCYHEEDAKH